MGGLVVMRGGVGKDKHILLRHLKWVGIKKVIDSRDAGAALGFGARR